MATYKWWDGFYFIGAMGCVDHYSLRVQAAHSRAADRWRDLGWWGCSVRASVTHPASCPAIPAVVMVHPVHELVVESRIGIARRFSCGGSVGCPGVAGGISGGSIGITSPEVSTAGATTATRARFPRDPKMEPAGTVSRAWQTASMLWPSGSSTNAP